MHIDWFYIVGRFRLRGPAVLLSSQKKEERESEAERGIGERIEEF
jgi:hypothetical protein